MFGKNEFIYERVRLNELFLMNKAWNELISKTSEQINERIKNCN